MQYELPAGDIMPPAGLIWCAAA